MTKRAINFFILFFCTLHFATYGKTKNEDENKLTPLQKEVETYIIDKFHCSHHISVEFGKKHMFDLNQLIATYKHPTILKDDPRAVRDNNKAFDWLIEVANEYLITYSMTYIFGTKDKEEAWSHLWMLLLLDDEENIIGHIRYFP